MSGPFVKSFTQRPAKQGRRLAFGAVTGMVLTAVADPFSAATKKKRKRNNKNKQKQPATCPAEAAECRQFGMRFCNLVFPAQFDACTTDLFGCCDFVEPCDLDLAAQCFAALFGTT